MTNELNEALKGAIEKVGKDRSIGNMPIMKGQKLTFIDGADGIEVVTTEINGEATSYGVFKTKEGYDVPFSQIARNNNGLTLTKTGWNDAIEEFASRIDGNYSVVVDEVKKVESSFGPGKQTYLIFKA